jgi:hypothetical protein
VGTWFTNSTSAIPDRIRTFRDAHRAEHIGPRYRGWAHFSTTTFGSLAAIAFAVWQVDAPSLLELACVPAFFVFANIVEYLGHRGPMHHRRRGLKMIFERHSLQHHQFYTHEAMEAESSRDFQMVLFPPLLLVFFLGAVGPLGALIALATTANLGWLFIATGVGYFLAYEWLHWSFHQPATSWVGRLAIVRWLRNHHLVHHDPQLMTRVNFNVTFPIGDRLFGTKRS